MLVAPLDAPDGIDAAVAELYCREQFVVDSYEVIGRRRGLPGRLSLSPSFD